VQGIRDPGGRRAWVVEIPGTQDWSPVPGPDPFDLTADVASMAGRPSAAQRTVTRALELAGARPDEPVLLAGHSLGGMLAAGLAADPAFRARFRVTHVVTAGSPVAEYPIPPGVQVLSLEHADDVVPALDGGLNPDRVGWVTVRQRIRPGAVTADPLLTHGVEGYRATAALVDASSDPSLVAWRAGLAPFLRRPGATAVDLVVAGHRPMRTRRGGGGPAP
jgi:pimeloyl-ACP methyl ester carboxylesterase